MEVQASNESYVRCCMTVEDPAKRQDSTLRRRGQESIDRQGIPVEIVRGGAVILQTNIYLFPLQRMSTPGDLNITRKLWCKQEDDIQGGDYIYDIKRQVWMLFITSTPFTFEGEIVDSVAMAYECKRTVTLYRIVEKPTGVGGTVQVFEEYYRDIPAAVVYVRGSQSAQEMGQFSQSTHNVFLPATVELSENDRIQIGTDNLRVDAADKIAFPGVLSCLCCKDRR